MSVLELAMQPLVLGYSVSGPSTAGVWPNDDGSWPEALRPLDRVNRDAVGDCVVILGGVLIAAIGNVRATSGLWSSVVRTWLTLMWLRCFYDGRIPAAFLYEPIHAPEFASWVKTIHVLSRVSNSSGPNDLTWRYSGGDDWPGSMRALEKTSGQRMEEHAAQLAAAVGARLTWDRDPDDTTLRIDGSPYEMAKLGLLMQRDGQWKDRRLFAADLWRTATGGGVNGDGHPNQLEGWGVHLVKGGDHSDRVAMKDRTRPGDLMTNVSDRAFMAAGGTNRGYVFVDPEKDLVVARVRRSGVYIDQFLPSLLSALDL